MGKESTVSISNLSPNIGDRITVSINRSNSAYTHTLRYSFGCDSGVIVSKTSALSYSWTIPMRWCNEIPDRTEGTAGIFIDTYEGSTYIGSSMEFFQVYLPDSVKPTLTRVDVIDSYTDKPEQFAGLWIQGRSRPQVTGCFGSGSYGSTLKTYYHELDGRIYTGQNIVMNALKRKGKSIIKTYATDTRGVKSNVIETEIVSIEYLSPTVSNFTATRVNENGMEYDEGTRVKLHYEWSIDPMDNKNTKFVSVEYFFNNEWHLLETVDSPNYSGERTLLTPEDVTFSIHNTYKFRVNVSDIFGNLTFETNIATSFTLLNFSKDGHGLGIGKASEKEDVVQSALPFESQGYFQGTSVEGSNFVGCANTKRYAKSFSQDDAAWLYLGSFTNIDENGLLAGNTAVITVHAPQNLSLVDQKNSSITGTIRGTMDPNANPTNRFRGSYMISGNYDKQFAMRAYAFDGTECAVYAFAPVAMRNTLVEVVTNGNWTWGGTNDDNKDGGTQQTFIDETASACGYPVGSIYISTENVNPTVHFGGTWVLFGQNRFLLGAGGKYAGGATDGSETVTLTANQMPSHGHNIVPAVTNTGEEVGGYGLTSTAGFKDRVVILRGSKGGRIGLNEVGGGREHNNMPPWVGVFFWKRTA